MCAEILKSTGNYILVISCLEPAAEDFRIYWDNAYGVHHLYEDKQDYLIEILMECKKEGHPDMVYKFASTSKISFEIFPTQT